MQLRFACAAVFVAAATLSAEAEEITSNRGVACKLRMNAAALHILAERQDDAEWARRSSALMATEQCVLLVQGTAVTLKAPDADGLVEVEAKGQAGPLWTEAANVGSLEFRPPTAEVGDPLRFKVPAGMYYGCASLATIADARALIAEKDNAAYAALMEREARAGRCRRLQQGTELIVQRRERGEVLQVREAGNPDKLWVDELLAELEAAKAAAGG